MTKDLLERAEESAAYLDIVAGVAYPAHPMKQAAAHLRALVASLRAAEAVCEAAAGMKQHGSDYRNGTHANILRDALAALDEALK